MEQEPFNGATYHIVHLLSRIDIGIEEIKTAVKKEPRPPLPIWHQDRFWLAILGLAALLLLPAEKQDAVLRLLK